MNKIKVCIVTDGLFPNKVGGIQRHSDLLIRELIKLNRLELHVIHPHEDLNLFDGAVVEHLVQDIDLSKIYILEKYRYSKRVGVLLDAIKPDVIYAQGVVVWKKISKYRSRLITNPHGLESFQALGIKAKMQGVAFKLIQKYQFRNSTKVISLGGKLTEILKNIVATNRIAVIPNATTVKSDNKRIKRQFDSSVLKVLFVGRLAENKGIQYLLEAARTLESLNDVRFKFHIIGNGPLKEGIIKDKSKNVKVYGFISDEELHDIYQNSDLFLFPTLFEGMPTVILEAMTYKLPIITTDVGATTELVDNKNGFIIEKRNSKAVLDCLENFYVLNKLEKQQLSEGSFKKVSEKFTWELVAQQHLELFESIV